MQDPRPAGRRLFVGRRFALRRTPALALMALACGAAAAQEGNVATLPTVQVVGDTDIATTEGTGSYTPRATAASTGLSLTLRETPQSVTVVTRQRMEDENMLSLVDVMASTPGISVQNYDSERYSFNSRGFSISNYMYDGVPTSFDIGAGESALDPIIYDRIEVVRGATGLMSGTGNPSASINLVRKHAISREFTADMSVSAGTWDAYRGTLDLSTPLSANGNVRGRIVSAYQTTIPYLDGYENRARRSSAWWTPTTSRTTLSAGLQLPGQRGEAQQLGRLLSAVVHRRPHGLGLVAEHRRGLTSWHDDVGAFASLEHRFDSGWTVQAVGSHSKNEMDAKLLYLYDRARPATPAGHGRLARLVPGRPQAEQCGP